MGICDSKKNNENNLLNPYNNKNANININDINKTKYSHELKILYEENGRYEGEIKNDKKEGKGIFYWNNGNRYEGDFRNDKIEGKGIYYFNSGDRMMGDYYNDKPVGKHVRLTKNGDVKIENY